VGSIINIIIYFLLIVATLNIISRNSIKPIWCDWFGWHLAPRSYRLNHTGIKLGICPRCDCVVQKLNGGWVKYNGHY